MKQRKGTEGRAASQPWLEQAQEAERRYEQLRRNARAVFRATEGWQTAKSTEDPQRVFQEGLEEWQSGQFFLERLGATRYLDPKLMATLWQLRRELLDEGGPRTAAATMLVDLTVLSYYNALRLQAWMGDLALHIEHEFFGQEGPTVKVRQRYGYQLEGLAVEDHLRRLGEQLLPLFDRANRAVIRNLKALKELRRGPAAAVALGRAGQGNVASQQPNPLVGDGCACGRRGPEPPAPAGHEARCPALPGEPGNPTTVGDEEV